jgi:hypothetical protein
LAATHSKRGVASGSDGRLETLRLKLEDLQHENERLRDTRATITGQLGPLPISAAIVAGLVSGFGTEGKAHLDTALAIWALGVFIVMVLVSIVSSILKPYRKLRDEIERDGPKPLEAKNRTEWYERMIEVEEQARDFRRRPKACPDQQRSLWWRLIHRPTKDLANACDREWFGLFVTKTLFVGVIVLLIVARLVG